MTIDVRPDGVAVVTVTAPPAPRGRFRETVGEEIERLVARLDDDSRSVGAVLLLRGTDASRAVSDIGALGRMAFASDGEQAARHFAGAVGRLAGASKPIVAAVEGDVLGADFELALACRAIVASDEASTIVALPDVHLGLLPSGNGLLRVALHAGLRVALDLGLSGRSIGSTEAHRMKLVHDVRPTAALVDEAARRVRELAAPGGPSKGRARQRAWSDNVLARKLTLRRARLAVRASTRGHSLASERIVELLAEYSRRGFDAAADLEARSFGDLVVTEASRRLVELAATRVAFGPTVPRRSAAEIASHLSSTSNSYARRILTPYLREASLLVAEGTSAPKVDQALLDWGWSVGPLELLDELDLGVDARPTTASSAAPSKSLASEEIQLRCMLPLLNEAAQCLADGVIASPGDGDVDAVMALGFPPVRGGPFRYIDAVGPVELLRRTRAYEARFGERASPRAALIARAGSGERYYAIERG